MITKVLLVLQVFMVVLYASDNELSGTRIVKTDGSNNLKTFYFAPPSCVGQG
jgi:hypothetical protein